MLLWLEKSVKVPEAGLSKAVGGHFLETHFKEDFTEFLSYFHKRMKMSSCWRYTDGIKVVFLKGGSRPLAAVHSKISVKLYSATTDVTSILPLQHFIRQVGGLLFDFKRELRSLGDLVSGDFSGYFS